MENLFNVYVIWRLDGPSMITLLQFEESDIQRQAMQEWSDEDYVNQAYDTEFECEGSLADFDSYELEAIFEAKDLRFIF